MNSRTSPRCASDVLSVTEEAVSRVDAGDLVGALCVWPGAEVLLDVGAHHRVRKVDALDVADVVERWRKRRALCHGAREDGALQVGALEGRAAEVTVGKVGSSQSRLEESRAAHLRASEVGAHGVGAGKVLAVVVLSGHVETLERRDGKVFPAAAHRHRTAGDRRRKSRRQAALLRHLDELPAPNVLERRRAAREDRQQRRHVVELH
mmetsp:Transcript_11406/g.40174  ORF Transcript_11406/g.40174 Transcript_11406/m.40174 type:complete len:207 (+) Transcript_11406:1-621(+)